MSKWSYLAGIVDGEGTITIHRHRQHNRDTHQLRPRLIVCNTSTALINYLCSEFGGKVTCQTARNGGKTCYLWRLFSQADIQQVLRKISPHLIIKRHHADLLMRFIDARREARRENCNAPYGEIEQACYESIAQMNQK